MNLGDCVYIRIWLITKYDRNRIQTTQIELLQNTEYVMEKRQNKNSGIRDNLRIIPSLVQVEKLRLKPCRTDGKIKIPQGGFGNYSDFSQTIRQMLERSADKSGCEKERESLRLHVGGLNLK